MSILKKAAILALPVVALAISPYAQTVCVDTASLSTAALLSTAVAAKNYKPETVTQTYVYTGASDEYKFDGDEVEYEADRILFNVRKTSGARTNEYALPTKYGYLDDLRIVGEYSATVLFSEDNSEFKENTNFNLKVTNERSVVFSEIWLFHEAGGDWVIRIGDGGQPEEFVAPDNVRALRIVRDDTALTFLYSTDGENFIELDSIELFRFWDRTLSHAITVNASGRSDNDRGVIAVDEIVFEYERIAGSSTEEIFESMIDEALSKVGSDVNRDGQTNAQDVQAVINKILSGN